MMIPTVHLNGTGQETLMAELETAVVALSEAIQALRMVTVRDRDYYLQGELAYRQARQEMNARLEALMTVRNDLIAMHRGIDAQGRRQRQEER